MPSLPDVSPWTVAADLLDPPKGPMERYYADPVGFATDCIDWTGTDGLTPYQTELLAAIPTRKRVSARGPHGLGKTTMAAIAVHWFALTRNSAGIDWKVITTAGAWGQLERYLWPEIHKWASRLRWDVIGRPPYSRVTELLRLNLKLAHGAASAAASTNAALIEGAHAEALLYVFDEAKAIPVEIYDAAEGAFAGARPEGLPEAYAIANSTPGEPSGRFWAIHTRKPGLEDWWARHVTLGETVAAGRVSPDWAAQRAAQWGVTSAIYANRVLGEFAASDEDTVIPLAWVEAANERYREWVDQGSIPPAAITIFGVDVADTGTDSTVIATRMGDVITAIETHRGDDLMHTAGRVAALMHHPSYVAVVDGSGVGAGVVARLREEGHRTVAFIASARAEAKDHNNEIGFLNTRAAAWWRMRELLDPAYHPTVALPDHDLLIGELCAPHWWMTSSGRIQIEPKDDIRSRLGRSTDHADAVIQAFFTPAGTSSPAHAYYAGLDPSVTAPSPSAWPSRNVATTPWWEVTDELL